MAIYNYLATDSSGNPVKGSMSAQDEKAIIDRLQEMGFMPIGIDLADPSSTVSESAAGSSLSRGLFKKRVPSSAVMHFTHELASMLEAGLPLDRSFSILAGLEKNEVFKNVIIKIHHGITSGGTLAESMQEHPLVFPDIYVSMVRAGEAAGTLEDVFTRLNEYMEASRKLKDDIKSALIYPLLLIFVGGIAILTMVLFVIPKFATIFSDNNALMPLSTRMLLSSSEFMLSYWWAILAAAAVLAIGLGKWVKTDSGSLSVDTLKLKLPIFGPVIQKAVLSRFSRTLGNLLQAGLPILEALNIAVKTMNNGYMAADIKPLIDGVRRGRGVSVPLNEVASFPPLAVHMLTVGEETGKLDEMLLKLANNYDSDIKVSVKRLLALLEPAIILVMAIVVGFIVISLLLAIFSLNDMPL